MHNNALHAVSPSKPALCYKISLTTNYTHGQTCGLAGELNRVHPK